VIERAAQAAANLRSLATCNDGAALAARLPPHESPAAAAEVATLREQLAAARAHQVIGSHDEGLAITAEALRRARALDYPPLVAEALQRTGELQHNASAFATAEQTFLEAYFTAEALRHDEVQLAAAVRLAYLVGVHQARHDEGLLWSRHAQALIDRGGATVDERVVLLHSVGMIRAQQGDAQEARVLLERSLALTREHIGPDDPRAAGILIDLGNLDNDRGEHERAQPRYEQAYAVIEATLGPDHPLAIKALNNLGNALRGQGRFAPAREHLDRALALAGRVLPPGHPSTAIVMASLGELLADEGRTGDAESYFSRALTALAAAFGADHPHVVAVSTGLGDVRRRQGKLVEARADLERALAAAELLGATHPELVAPLSAWGDLLLAEGALAGASAAFARALAIVERANGPSHRHAVRPLVGLGEVALAESRTEAALGSLERALALTTRSRVAPWLVARVQFGLARARWEVSAARPTAAALAREAAYVLTAAGEGHAEELVTIQRWLASR
jgi:tetratricopeptide (TPR) repeat protein